MNVSLSTIGAFTAGFIVAKMDRMLLILAIIVTAIFLFCNSYKEKMKELFSNNTKQETTDTIETNSPEQSELMNYSIQPTIQPTETSSTSSTSSTTPIIDIDTTDYDEIMTAMKEEDDNVTRMIYERQYKNGPNVGEYEHIIDRSNPYDHEYFANKALENGEQYPISSFNFE